MRTIKLLLVIITNYLLLNGCDEQDVTPIAQWTWSDTDRSFAEIDITPGTTIDVVLETPEPPYEYAFRVIIPKIIDEVNGNPLVFSMHGGVGGASRKAHKNLECIAPALESINAFVLSPNADKVQWYEVYSQKKVTKLITLAANNWPIDITKIVATGYSDGGNGTWFMAEVYPEIFSAGIALASSYNTLTTEGKARRIKTPLYVIHSSGDELFPLEQTQNWVDRTIAVGSDVKFIIADGLSHYAPCDYTSYFEDAVQWLEQEVWQ
jgi:predicted peptidase